jgi:hypothetical protein
MSRSGINPPIRKSARDIRAGPRYVRFTPKADIPVLLTSVRKEQITEGHRNR